jgi:amidase
MRTAPADFEHATTLELTQALAAREVSAIELCDAAIGRIEDRDAGLNAVVVRDFDRAREQARKADAALGRGERGALLGVPMTVKESFNVAGLPTTWGFEFARRIPVHEDAVAVSRLKAAGAVILGKTNVALALGDYESNNPVYGRTRNPHDTTRSPGGSSGGAAAALAAGMVSLELGSDIGGSIRVPAHFCGVYGHKPTHGLLPTGGHDFPGQQVAPDVLSVIGPLARCARDLELALDVLAGPDQDKAVGYRLALPAPRARTPQGLRALLLTQHPAAQTSADIQQLVDTVGHQLTQQGAMVSRASDLLPDVERMHQDFAVLLRTLVTRGAPNSPTPVSSHEWLAILDRRHKVRRQWARLFESFDVVIAPAFGCAAFPHIEKLDWTHTTLDINGQATPYLEQMAWAGPATFAGLPATVAPAGKTATGLPLGVQIIGPYLGDRTTLAVAQMVGEPARHQVL